MTAPDNPRTAQTMAGESNSRSTGKKHRRRSFYVVLGVLVLLVTLGASEIAVRIYVASRGWTSNCYAGSIALFEPHAETGYLLKPGFKLVSGTWRISVNDHGFRGPPIRPDKGLQKTRVAIVGGSSVFGYLVNDGEEAARRLEKALGSRFEVINGGVPGHNLNQTLWRFENQIAPLEPDVLIIYLGWNDLGYIVSKNPSAAPFVQRPVVGAWTRAASKSTLFGLVVFRLLGKSAQLSAETLPSTTPTKAGATRFRINLNQLIQSAKAKKCRVVVCAQVTAAHENSGDSLRHFLGETKKKQQEMIQLGQWQRKVLAQAAEENQVAFFDMNQLIAPNESNLRDYVHLSADGEERLAVQFARITKKLLEKN